MNGTAGTVASLCAVCTATPQPISVTVTWEREVFLRTLSEEHAVLALFGALTDASGEF